jgi:hypothetical protein
MVRTISDSRHVLVCGTVMARTSKARACVVWNRLFRKGIRLSRCRQHLCVTLSLILEAQAARVETSNHDAKRTAAPRARPTFTALTYL